MSLKSQIDAYLGADGRIAQAVDGYQVRQAQVEMAETVADIIEQDGSLLAEAGTGTGKTFSYLIPALLSGQKVIVSTATKTLQDQLLTKDIPLLMDVCGISGTARVLKGRENYLCPQRLEIAETAEQNTKEVWKKLNLIHDWQLKTRNADKSELQALDENDQSGAKCARVWSFARPMNAVAMMAVFIPGSSSKLRMLKF